MTPYWQSSCGRYTLYCGDALEVLPTLEGIGAVVTDPPYSSGGQFRGDRQQSTRVKYQSSDVIEEHPCFSGDSRDQRGWFFWSSLWLLKAREACVPGAMLCMFTDWRQLPTATDAVQSGGWVWRGIVPWDKVVARPQPDRFRAQCEYVVWCTNGPRDFSYEGEYHDGIIRVRTPTTDEREHSTQKPVDAIMPLVKTAPDGGVVFDPFTGSGTTGVACVKTGRRFIGIEIEERYCEIAARRIEREASHLFAEVG